MRLFRYTLLILFLGILFLSSVIFRTRPQYEGKVNFNEVEDSVEVWFDKYGIPHIYGSSEEDVYAALGYVHAQDRLFQMEMMRRAGGGRLSEIYGEDVIEVDRFFRTLGIPSKARYEAQRFNDLPDSDMKRSTLAYLSGINHYIEHGREPLEFKIAGMPRTEFRVEDMFLIAGAMSFNFAVGLKTDPLLTYIREELGPEYLNGFDIHPGEDEVSVPVYPISKKRAVRKSSRPKMSTALRILEDIQIPTFYGSNTWAIAPSKSEDAVTILANDAHIGYAQPCTWYEAHLEYPDQRIYGNFLAGIPFALTGHNDYSAWGVTMLLNDDMDLFREELSEDSLKYRSGKDWKPLEFVTDTIHISDGEYQVLRVAYTHHGPLVTDFVDTGENEEVSLFWTFLGTDCNLLQGFYKLGNSKDMDSAKQAVSMISSPGLNISYADRKGNIALWAAAHFIDRPDHVDPAFFLDGVSGLDEPLGYLSFDENPSLENPPWGFIYSANNQHRSYDGSFYPGYYEPDYRASRIVQKISARNDWSVEAMKQFMMDDETAVHDRMNKDLLSMLRWEQLEWTDSQQEAIDILREWGGTHSMDDEAPTIYYRWLYHIIDMKMRDELGDERFEVFLKTNAIKQSFPKLICDEQSKWWDDTDTKEIEARSEIIVKAFRTTLDQLESQFGSLSERWTWGNVHQTVHAHAFNDIPLIGRFFSVGPYPSPGGIESINNSMFYLTDDEVINAQYGPQMRRIINLDAIENSVSISPTGQSGVLMSKHYDDQAEMYLRGIFRPQHMSLDRIKRESSLLTFIPVADIQ